MFKYLLIFCFLFISFTSFVFAKIDKQEAKLKQEFGQDLTHAPFFLRFSYSKQYGKEWKESNYEERKDFLAMYENNIVTEKLKEKAEAKAEADRQKELLSEKKRIKRRIEDRIKAELAQEKADKKYDEERQKAFDNTLKEQRKELQDMVKELQQEEMQVRQNSR